MFASLRTALSDASRSTTFVLLRGFEEEEVEVTVGLWLDEDGAVQDVRAFDGRAAEVTLTKDEKREATDLLLDLCRRDEEDGDCF